MLKATVSYNDKDNLFRFVQTVNVYVQKINSIMKATYLV